MALVASLTCARGLSSARGVAGPSPIATAAYLQGQAYERFFQDHLMAGTCGIVLERPRCLADFHTVKALRGADPTDSAIEAWLATGNYAQRATDWNGLSIPDKSWTTDPESSWWLTAGQISIATSMPQNDASAAYVTHAIDALTAHAETTPEAFRDLILSSGSPFARLAPLQAALLKAIPVDAYPNTSTVAGPRGDVQLGIMYATLQQLIDNPLALSRPESRAFGLGVLNKLDAIDRSYGEAGSFSAAKNMLAGQIPDGPSIDGLRRSLAHAVSLKWPMSRGEALLTGAVTAQVAYNAAVLRSPDDDKTFRNVLRRLPLYAGVSSNVRNDIKTLLAIPPAAAGGDWNAINAAASKTVTDMFAG